MEYRHYEFVLNTRVYCLELKDNPGNEEFPFAIVFSINDIELAPDGLSFKNVWAKFWFFKYYEEAIAEFDELYHEKK